MNTIVHLLLLVLVLSILYVVCVCIQLQFRWRSWLRDLPGPSSDSFCYGNMYELICRDVVPVFLKWTARYGSAVRIWGTFGEPRLLLTDPVGLDYILRKRAYAYPKVRIVRRMLGKVMGFGLLAAEGETHKRQKRAIQPGFSNRSIHKLTPIFQRHAHLLYEHLLDLSKEQSNDALVDVYRLMGSAALDAIGSAAFHIEFNSLARAKAHTDGRVLSTHPLMVAFERTLDIATANSMARNLFDALTMIFPRLEKLPIGVESARFRKTAQVLTHVASQLVQEAKTSVLGPASELYHKQTEDERPDLLAALLRANSNAQRPNDQKNSVLDKAELSDNELTAQLSTFLFAGHETTATQITWLIWALAQDQHIQVKLREEIRALRKRLKLQQYSRSGALDEYRDLTLEELDSLPYLDACVRESLRLHGVVHTTSRMATQRDVIPCSDGRRILVEKDTVVMLPLAAISRDPELWGKDAGTFNPERWSEPLPGKSLYSSYGGLSFLFGPHACIGRRFAIAEMKCFASILVNGLDFQSDGFRTIVKRWIVSRPYDVRTHQDACILRVRSAA